MKDVDREIDVLIRARYPLLYVVSSEEERVEKTVRDLAGDRKQVLTWTVTRPFGAAQGAGSHLPIEQALQALDCVLQGARSSTPTLVILKDFDPYLDDPVVVRKLRDVATALKRSYNTLIIVSPVLKVPPHLEKDITVVDYNLPDLEELSAILNELVQRVQNAPNVSVAIDDQQREALLKAALGLTADEAQNVFAKALVRDGRLDAMDVQVVLSEKKQIIRKTGILEYYEPEEGVADVGGLENLKNWLRKRTSAFTERARKFGLPEPKGVLLLGVQGCGKSLVAKAVASLWNLPLLRFDVGAVFGKYIGESENNIRRVIKTAESLAPCLIWVDELEKAFAGTQGGGDDTGTTQRVLGTFLTWLQEKKSPVFVIASSNDISQLPPELLRKGRFDEIFFVDLPTFNERCEIFRIHLQKRGRHVESFDLDLLSRESIGFSGAEIEQAIIAGLYDAFDAGHDLTTDDILNNIHLTVPLSQTMREDIESLRLWARTRARAASAEVGEEEAADARV
jgi:SpoVK/Ycf46/Vps4 family AAA+-type ATPase